MEEVLQGGDMVCTRDEANGENLLGTEAETETDRSGEALGDVVERGLLWAKWTPGLHEEVGQEPPGETPGSQRERHFECVLWVQKAAG